MSREWINPKNGESNSVVTHWSSTRWRMLSISLFSITFEIARASRRGDGAKDDKGGGKLSSNMSAMAEKEKMRF